MSAVLAIALVIGMLATGVAGAQEASPAGDPSPATTGASAEDLVFTVGTIEDMKSISPFKACCSPEYEMMFMVYDQLLNFDTDTLGAAPDWPPPGSPTRTRHSGPSRCPKASSGATASLSPRRT